MNDGYSFRFPSHSNAGKDFTMKTFLAVTLSTLAAFPAMASPARAEVTEKDTLVIGRIIGLLQDIPKGDVEVAVVTNGADVQKDVDSFLRLVGDGKQVGNTTLKAISITPADAASTSARVLLLPGGLDGAQLDAAFSAAQERKLVTISTSDTCLASKRCAIAIKTEPAVDIKMSSSAAAATGVNFGSTFRMMIKEVP